MLVYGLGDSPPRLVQWKFDRLIRRVGGGGGGGGFEGFERTPFEDQ